MAKSLKYKANNNAIKIAGTDEIIRVRRDLSRNIMITQHFNEKIVTPGEDVSNETVAAIFYGC